MPSTTWRHNNHSGLGKWWAHSPRYTLGLELPQSFIISVLISFSPLSVSRPLESVVIL